MTQHAHQLQQPDHVPVGCSSLQTAIGYLAQVLVRPPTDLRRFGERYGASLGAERLARFIDGREMVGAHGERDMPVWGERFYDIEAKGSAREKDVRKRIDAIVTYVLSIEVKAGPKRIVSDHRAHRLGT